MLRAKEKGYEKIVDESDCSFSEIDTEKASLNLNNDKIQIANK